MQTPPWVFSLIGGVALVLLGASVDHFWSRYKNRLRRVRWSAQYLRIAIASQDQQFGRVDVLYNNKPVRNLHTAVIQVENESNFDLENVNINIVCTEGSKIFAAIGMIEGALDRLPFTDQYLQAFQQTGSKEPHIFETWRAFRIPVLNRAAKVNFYLLLSRDDHVQPVVTISCVHRSVKFTQRAPSFMWWGVPYVQALVVGLFVTLALVLFLSWKVTSTWLIGFLSWLLALSVVAFGAAAVRAFRLIARALD